MGECVIYMKNKFHSKSPLPVSSSAERLFSVASMTLVWAERSFFWLIRLVWSGLVSFRSSLFFSSILGSRFYSSTSLVFLCSILVHGYQKCRICGPIAGE